MLGSKIEDVIPVIERSLNVTVNHTLSCSPEEIVKGIYSLDPHFRQIQININKVKQRVRKAGLKRQNFRNKSRSSYQFQPGDLVMIPNRKRNKLDSLWSGLFKLVNFGRNPNQIRIRFPNCTSVENIKNLKLDKKVSTEGAQDVVS